MKEFRGRPVISSMRARLMPPGDQYEDCIATLILTDGVLYVTEECGGKFEALFELPTESVQTVDKYSEEFSKAGKPAEADTEYEKLMRTGLFGAGIIPYMIENARLSKNRPNIRTYLRITYNDNTGRERRLFFSEYSQEIGSFIRKFKKMKRV